MGNKVKLISHPSCFYVRMYLVRSKYYLCTLYVRAMNPAILQTGIEREKYSLLLQKQRRASKVGTMISNIAFHMSPYISDFALFLFQLGVL